MAPPTDPFLSLAENSPYFIGICDNDMVPFFVNAAGRKAVGIGADADVSKLLVKDFFFPEDQEFMLTEFFDRVMRDGKAEVEIRFRNFETGAPIWMLYSVFPVFGESGARIGFATVSRDISNEISAREALRASELRFRQLAELTPQIIWVTRGDGTVEYVNEQWTAFSGLDLAASSDRSNVAELTHPDDRAMVRQRWAEAMKTGEALEIEVRLRGRDGAYRWFLARTVPLRDSDGKAVRWFTASTDIHAQKEASRALEEVDHRKDAFLATLSHELRTPLTAGFGWAKLLSLSDDAELRATGLHAIEQSFTSQIRLIDDLLDVSRIIAGKMQFEMETLDLATAIDAAVDTVRNAAAQRNVHIVTDIAPGIIVNGDAARLTQVVWNLLSNAIKFTPPEGTVEVRLRRAGDGAEITVRDSGQGIDPEFLPFVFDRFRQADPSVNRRHGGLGLGLSIVASLVEAHGGSVRAESPGEGKGATFTVTIPLVDRVQIPPPRYAGLERAESSEMVSGARVLVVDDDDASRTLMTTILERAGAEVRAFSNAGEAVSALTGWQPHVLLSDLSMPVDDGFSLVRGLRAAGNDVPAIAVTAYVRTEDAALTAGFQGHLPKPFTPADLIARVKAVVGTMNDEG